MLTRTITGALLIIVLTLALYIGGWVFAALWVLCLCVAMYEVYNAFSEAGHRPVAWPAWLCLVISPPSFILLSKTDGLALLVAMLYLSFLMVSGIVMFRAKPKLEDMLISLLPLFHVVLPGLSMLGLMRADPVSRQHILMAAVFVIPVLGDAGAYFTGVRFGKTRLIPEVSPKKTVEGAAGGLAASTLGALLVYLAGRAFGAALPPMWHFALLGLCGGVAGQLGDLFASLIKRHCNLKDYGHIFPGHGGMMDRLDSVLFVSVLVFLYQNLW